MTGDERFARFSEIRGRAASTIGPDKAATLLNMAILLSELSDAQRLCLELRDEKTNDLTFYLHAISDVPFLLAEIERLRVENDHLAYEVEIFSQK